jgi:AcrR family transcriptional regulator
MEKKQRATKLGRPFAVSGEKPTREKIFEAAIDLFARQGFDRTSIRQIAGALGLTESALYRHYSGKEAILSSIFEYAETAIFTPLPIEDDRGEYAGQSIFRGLLLPLPEMIGAMPVISRIMRIMYAELNHNEKIRGLFVKTYVQKAEDYIEALFAKQMDKGAIRRCDARALARVFNAFRSEWAFRNFIVETEATPDIEALKKDLEGPIRFFEQYWVPEEER